VVALRQQEQIWLLPQHPRPRLRAVDAIDAPLPRVRSEALPEHADYRDTGCEFSASCLRCPLARCKHDDPRWLHRLTVDARNREIVLLRTRHRAPIDMLAAAYGLTRRHVFRILRGAREQGRAPKPLRTRSDASATPPRTKEHA
jgi:hypothetical protein